MTTKLKPVEETVKAMPADYEQIVGGISNQKYYKQITVVRTLLQDRHTIYTALKAKLEGQKKEFVPATIVWEGDEEQEVGQWKFVPKENGLYCLNCERFTMEEGCTCGVVNIDFVLTFLDELFGVSK